MSETDASGIGRNFKDPDGPTPVQRSKLPAELRRARRKLAAERGATATPKPPPRRARPPRPIAVDPDEDPREAARRWFAEHGWEPFPFQEEVWDAYLNGESGLVHAATGTGKTYAVWLGPVLEWLRAPATRRNANAPANASGCRPQSSRRPREPLAAPHPRGQRSDLPRPHLRHRLSSRAKRGICSPTRRPSRHWSEPRGRDPSLRSG